MPPPLGWARISGYKAKAVAPKAFAEADLFFVFGEGYGSACHPHSDGLEFPDTRRRLSRRKPSRRRTYFSSSERATARHATPTRMGSNFRIQGEGCRAESLRGGGPIFRLRRGLRLGMPPPLRWARISGYKAKAVAPKAFAEADLFFVFVEGYGTACHPHSDGLEFPDTRRRLTRRKPSRRRTYFSSSERATARHATPTQMGSNFRIQGEGCRAESLRGGGPIFRLRRGLRLGMPPPLRWARISGYKA